MTALDELFSTDVSLRARQTDYRKSMLEDMAYAVASDLKDGKVVREVAVPVLSGFLKAIMKAGQGQAEKADKAANMMVDEQLKALGATDKAVDAVVADAKPVEQPEGETGLEEVEPEDVTEEKPQRQRRSAA